MSGIRVITRIIPDGTPPERLSGLFSTKNIDKTSFTSLGRFVDPRTSKTYLVHTTYCEKINFEPGTDVESAIAAKCESTPGLRCLRKNSKQPATEVSSVAVEPRFGEISVVSLRDCMTNGFRLSVPSQMPLVEGFTTTEIGPKLLTTAESRNAANKFPGSSTDVAGHNDSSNDMDKENDANTMSELLAPLYKYIVGNKCTLCGFVPSGKRKSAGIRHLATHLTERKFKCEICEKGFVTPEGLSMHKRVHMESVYPCETCGRKYKDRTQLKVHVRRKHTHVQVHKCPICEKNLSSTKAIKEHHRTHTGERPYQCDICLKKFQTSGSLRTHTLHHKAEKPFTCSICDKGYTRKRLLDDHMNTHAKKAPYKCDQCGKTFNFKPNLLQHKVVHSDLRKHECGTCGMKFKFPHHLKNHINTHTHAL